MSSCPHWRPLGTGHSGHWACKALSASSNRGRRRQFDSAPQRHCPSVRREGKGQPLPWAATVDVAAMSEQQEGSLYPAAASSLPPLGPNSADLLARLALRQHVLAIERPPVSVLQRTSIHVVCSDTWRACPTATLAAAWHRSWFCCLRLLLLLVELRKHQHAVQ
jgi:hypothetical protein